MYQYLLSHYQTCWNPIYWKLRSKENKQDNWVSLDPVLMNQSPVTVRNWLRKLLRKWNNTPFCSLFTHTVILINCDFDSTLSSLNLKNTWILNTCLESSWSRRGQNCWSSNHRWESWMKPSFYMTIHHCIIYSLPLSVMPFWKVGSCS